MKHSNSFVVNRQRQVLAYLAEHPTTTAQQLADHFEISISTARRDINALSRTGDIIKKYDPNAPSFSLPDFDAYPVISHKEIKDNIAQAAAALIENDDVVFINSSSTALHVISSLTINTVSILTNNGNAMTVPRHTGIDVILLGGEIALANPGGTQKMSLTGDFTLNNIRGAFANKCILGVSGISVDSGLTSMFAREMAVNREMIANTRGKVIVVADHRKIGVRHNFIFSDIRSVDILITDINSDREELERIRQTGVEVITVDGPSFS